MHAYLKGRSPNDLAISTITSFELFSGFYNSKKKFKKNEGERIQKFISSVHELTFDSQSANEAAKQRVLLEKQGCPIGPFDILIAGHAISTGLTLITDNVREFSRIDVLNIENWKK